MYYNPINTLKGGKMKKYYTTFLAIAMLTSVVFAAGKAELSWSSEASQLGTKLALKTVATGLPDSVLQIKNVRANVDIDADGNREILVPVLWEDTDGTSRRSLFVYENVGDDNYALVWSYQFPGVADQFVTVDQSDLDGDGNLEILAVNVRAEGDADDGPNLYVFEHTGADNDFGTEPTVTWDLGNADRDVVRVAKAADLDGDGKQEVVMTAFQTQPAIVIASVSNFTLPTWTTEYVNNEIGGSAPDIAAIGIGDMDADGTPEVILTEGATDKLLVIEASAANTYALNEVDMPVAGKTVSVHSIEVGDVDEDGRDEAFIANLQGTVWVVKATGDAMAVGSADIHAVAETEEQWLEAGLGDLGLGGVDFVIAGSNASKAVTYRYLGGDVTDPASYTSETLIEEGTIEGLVPGGIRVYGLDFGGDMDGDGYGEIVFTRGSTRGGKGAPALMIAEVMPLMAMTALPDSVLQIKNIRANVDLDGDGNREMVVPVLWEDNDGTSRRSLYVYENSGNDSYDMVWSYDFPGAADQFVTVDQSDLDGDGNLEILAVNVRAEGDADDGPNLYVFEHTGADNDFGTEPTVTWDLGNADRDVVRVAKAADLDGDGKQEVVMTAFQTQPAIVIASVSNFTLPTWTTEYVNNEIGGSAPDIAAIGIGDMDADGTPEVILTEGATDKLLVIEASAANTYALNEVDMPVAGKTVSVHSIEVGDVDEDGRDEAFIANLQGTVWVVKATGDAMAVGSADIHAVAETEEQWLEAGLGDLGLGGVDFVIAGSNASKAVTYRYLGGDVTDPASYTSETLIEEGTIEGLVPGGIRVYGLDFGGDMDGDGYGEIVFTRGSTRGGKDAPSIFITEVIPVDVVGIEDKDLVAGKFALGQNFPNPFNPSTTIEYRLAANSQVKLVIYDVVGRVVKTLVNENQAASTYKVVWNGTNNANQEVASGVYFYRLETAFGATTKSMTYIR
jgi:hypothetical protein